MKKKPAKRHEGMFFVYYHGKPQHSEYSHPEVHIFQANKDYPSCSPDNLLQFTSQTGGLTRQSNSLRSSYSLKVELDVAGYRTETAVKLLHDFGLTGADRPSNIFGVIKKLRKMGIPRYSSEPVATDADGWTRNEMIPRKFKRQAALYWAALKAGRRLV